MICHERSLFATCVQNECLQFIRILSDRTHICHLSILPDYGSRRIFSICSKGCHHWQPFALHSATAQTELLRLFFAVDHLNLSTKAAQLLIKALIAPLNIDDVIYHCDAVRRQGRDDKCRSCS